MDSGERTSTHKEANHLQLTMLELAGQVDYFDDYDYKALRRKQDEKLKRLLEERHD